MLCWGLTPTSCQLSTALALPALSQALASSRVSAVWFRRYANAGADAGCHASSQGALKVSDADSGQKAPELEQGAVGAGNDAAQNALKHTKGSGMRTTPLCRLTGLCGRSTRVIDTNMRCPICLMDRRDSPVTFFPAVSIDKTVRLQHTCASTTEARPVGWDHGWRDDGRGAAASGAASTTSRSTTPAFSASCAYLSPASACSSTSFGNSPSPSSAAACGRTALAFPTHIRAHSVQARQAGAISSAPALCTGYAPLGALQPHSLPALQLPPAALPRLNLRTLDRGVVRQMAGSAGVGITWLGFHFASRDCTRANEAAAAGHSSIASVTDDAA